MVDDPISDPSDIKRRRHTRGAAMERTAVEQFAYARREEEPTMAPPRSEVGAVGWLRANLFSSVTNTILTVLGIALVVWIVPPFINWAFVHAVWIGSSRDDCIVPGTGACWAFVDAKFAQFMYGRYPLDERWRVDLTGILLVIGLIPMAIPRVPFKRENAIFLLVVLPLVALVLLTGGHFGFPTGFVFTVLVVACIATGLVAGAVVDSRAGRVARILTGVAILVVVASFFIPVPPIGSAGLSVPTFAGLTAVSAGIAAISGLQAIRSAPGRPGSGALWTIWAIVLGLLAILVLLSVDFGMPFVETQLWGGLMVTLVVAIVGMVSSLPIGVLLALGRRSDLPVVKFASIVFIEFWRGVPLITVLFMSSVMLPVFLPPGVNFDKLLRALIGVSLFTSAYMAETVRGGLQAIPKGQYEGARALGLPYWRMMQMIILPQALKIVIPGIVNSFISLFKDTSLVLIIGLFDLLGIVQLNFSDSNWASFKTPATGYVFAAFVFWLFCFGMSRYSIYTERRLDTGYRR
jgi:general L-amino acid transport system permease protein